MIIVITKNAILEKYRSTFKRHRVIIIFGFRTYIFKDIYND